jgi:hypothetical protein
MISGEPIRNVAVYSEIVACRYDRALELDEEGKQYLGFLVEGGTVWRHW